MNILFAAVTVFFILNQEIHTLPHKSHKSRTAKRLFSSDFIPTHDGSQIEVQFPPVVDVCISDTVSSAKSLCLPIHRCYTAGILTSFPKICGWSSLLPDVCCILPDSDIKVGEAPSPSENVTILEQGNQTITGNPDPLLSTPSVPEDGMTVGIPAAGISDTMPSKTSATKESISMMTAVPPEQNTVIKWTDVTAATTTERPFTALTTSIAGSDKRSTAFPLTSTAASLAWITRGPVVPESNASMPAKSVSGELMKKTTPMPAIAYKNSLNCGLADEKNVWPFVVSLFGLLLLVF